MHRFIVAEVSKNWPDPNEQPTCVAERFEMVINRNLERGYRLHSWRLNQLMTSTDQMVETIIAVFERVQS